MIANEETFYLDLIAPISSVDLEKLLNLHPEMKAQQSFCYLDNGKWCDSLDSSSKEQHLLVTDDMTELHLLIGEYNLYLLMGRKVSDKLKEMGIYSQLNLSENAFKFVC